MALMKTPDKHNIHKLSATARNQNSVYDPGIASPLSAFLSASASAVLQSGRYSALLAKVPFSGGIIPSSGTFPTGWSDNAVMLLPGHPSAHIAFYPDEDISGFWATNYWIITGR